MPSVLDRLTGGDLRSIGAADAVALEAREDRRTFDALVGGLGDKDKLVRMRSADALEKASRFQPAWLARHAQALLAATTCPQLEVRWHVAQMIPRLRWQPAHFHQVTNWLVACLDDDSLIVRTSAMTALAELAEGDAALSSRVAKLLVQSLVSPAASVRSRARKLLQEHPRLRSASGCDPTGRTKKGRRACH